MYFDESKLFVMKNVRSFPSPFTPSHQYAYSPYYALDILTWRICFKLKLELILKLVIVSFVLMTLISDSAVILLGEIRS